MLWCTQLASMLSMQGFGTGDKLLSSSVPDQLCSAGQDLAADRQKLFNGKQLVTSVKSAYQISWPIILWGVLVIILYAVSYQGLAKEHNIMAYIKMTQKSRVAASRLTYYALRISLEQVRGAWLMQMVMCEAKACALLHRNLLGNQVLCVAVSSPWILETCTEVDVCRTLSN